MYYYCITTVYCYYVTTVTQDRNYSINATERSTYPHNSFTNKRLPKNSELQGINICDSFGAASLAPYHFFD